MFIAFLARCLMPWLHFTATYDFIPKPAVTIRYPAGYVGLVTTPCANRAVAAGKAERLPTPTKDEAEAWRSAQAPAA